MACGLVAAKLNIKIAHIEAGLRSFDEPCPKRNQPNYHRPFIRLFIRSEKSGLTNLEKEGISEKKNLFCRKYND